MAHKVLSGKDLPTVLKREDIDYIYEQLTGEKMPPDDLFSQIYLNLVTPETCTFKRFPQLREPLDLFSTMFLQEFGPAIQRVSHYPEGTLWSDGESVWIRAKPSSVKGSLWKSVCYA